MPTDPLSAARIGGARAGRVRIGLGAAVVLTLVGLAIAVVATAWTAGSGTTSVALASPAAVEGATPSPRAAHRGAPVVVHILGAVTWPGLYHFREGDRAIDAVAAAGGYAEDADRRQLNLARFLVDGEQIYVPIVGEVPVGAPGVGPGAGPGGGHGSGAGKVNLNTADAAALETLPRVGPALAARILAWRDANGRFASVEDLLGVSGIGEKTFAGLKDLVTI